MGELQAQTKGDRAKMLPVPSVRSLFPHLQRARPKFQLPPVRRPRPEEERLQLESLLFPLQGDSAVFLDPHSNRQKTEANNPYPPGQSSMILGSR
ncbi:hypothetical protein J6590_107428 [Homalodisca vitripennis]|nr:hypothetical protein J6590_107428 [Homalodisca vitripennis]